MLPTTYTIAKLVLLLLMIIASTETHCLAKSRVTAPDLHSCGYSNQVYESDQALMLQRSPTRFNLMSSRYVDFIQAARGYHCSGTATVAFNGHDYVPAGMGDDPGIPVLIPALASWTGMTLIESFDLTALVVIASGILLGYAGFFRSYPDRRLRWLGVLVFGCLGLVEAKVADFYIFQVSPLIAGIPWLVHFGLRGRSLALTLCSALFAFFCSWFSFARTGTSIICMAFIIPLLAFRYRARRLVFPLVLVLLAYVPSVLFARYLMTVRNEVLARHGQSALFVNSHPIWHPIYLGLGFVPNAEVPEFNDSVAALKVRSIDPTVPYLSPEYELILKHEVFNLAKHKPILLIENLAAKIGVVAVLAFVLLFPARRLLFAERQLLWLDAAFVSAMGVSALSAILVVPKPAYLLPFFCLTCLYSLVKVCVKQCEGGSNFS